MENKTGNILQRNNEARSCEVCYIGEAIIITYSECVFVALDFQLEIRMGHIFIYGLYDFHFISKTARLQEKKKLLTI